MFCYDTTCSGRILGLAETLPLQCVCSSAQDCHLKGIAAVLRFPSRSLPADLSRPSFPGHDLTSYFPAETEAVGREASTSTPSTPSSVVAHLWARTSAWLRIPADAPLRLLPSLQLSGLIGLGLSRLHVSGWRHLLVPHFSGISRALS